MTQDRSDQGFTVTDKRHFTAQGEIREQGAEKAAQAASSGQAGTEARPPRQEPEQAGAEEHIDFPSYILTYYTQGLVLLGEVPNPYTNKKEENLDAARHTIEILAMLQGKTRGNLTSEEDQLLDNVLYELRMKFMARTNRIKL
ncbi:MAG: DUF1844 domain-containing protein [Acidobacteria bacterium]|nr:DUF1844 domain-containing protein [Acidobacteriota bacterium]